MLYRISTLVLKVKQFFKNSENGTVKKGKKKLALYEILNSSGNEESDMT